MGDVGIRDIYNLSVAPLCLETPAHLRRAHKMSQSPMVGML